MIELKPCPFCGGEADVWSNENEMVNYRAFGYGARGYATRYKCYCKRCGATGQTVQVEKGCEFNTFWQKDTKTKAIEVWNRRCNDGQ